MRGIPIPEYDEDFTADPAELFFDLTFVFAFSRLVSLLIHDPNWTGVGEFVLLFAMIWLPWSQFTWSANAVAGNSRPVRALFMVATVASILMAGSVTSAFDDGGPVFALMLSVILAIALGTMIAGLPADHDVRASILRYSIPNWVAIALMVTGGLVAPDLRVWFWLAAVAIVIWGTFRTGSSEWIIRPGHFAERHGLLIIVALGEVIVAIGLPVVGGLDEGAGLPAQTVVALVSAGAFAALLWWAYFDRPSPALEHRHHQISDGVESGTFARYIYTYFHFPLVGGIILAAAALEEITLHPSEPLADPFRWMLVAGLAACLLAVAAAVYRAFHSVAIERIVAALGLTFLIAVGGGVDGVVLLIVVDIVLVAMLVVEHLRVEVRYRDEIRRS